MPGKKGFGDTRKKSSQSPAYKKQKFAEAKSPFVMKSAFKQWAGTGMLQRPINSGATGTGWTGTGALNQPGTTGKRKKIAQWGL